MSKPEKQKDIRPIFILDKLVIKHEKLYRNFKVHFIIINLL